MGLLSVERVGLTAIMPALEKPALPRALRSLRLLLSFLFLCPCLLYLSVSVMAGVETKVYRHGFGRLIATRSKILTALVQVFTHWSKC